VLPGGRYWAELVRSVYTIEIVSLSRPRRESDSRGLGYRNVEVRNGRRL